MEERVEWTKMLRSGRRNARCTITHRVDNDDDCPIRPGYLVVSVAIFRFCVEDLPNLQHEGLLSVILWMAIVLLRLLLLSQTLCLGFFFFFFFFSVPGSGV